MAFNNWPWTSLQNLNLDWILRVCKEAKEAADNVDTFDTRITTAQQTAEAADLTATTAANNADTARTEAATAQATANAAQASASAANTAISNIRQVPVSLLADVGKFLKATLNGSEWDAVREVPDTDGVSNGEVLTKTAGGYEWTSALGSGGTEVYYYNIDTGNTSSGTGHLSRTGGATATLLHMIESFGIGEIIPIIRFTTNAMSNENTPVFIPLEISTSRAIFGAYDSANSNFRIMTVPYGNNVTVTLQTIAISGGSSLPAHTSADRGKALFVDNYGDLVWDDDHVLPDYDQNDSGKFLRIDSNGYAAWQTVPAAENASFGGA